MPKRGKRVSVRRGDHERVVITDTLPFETPIIFSGDGFYRRLKEGSASGRIHETLAKYLVTESTTNVTIPFTYKIRKGTSEFRKLAVLHPVGLWQVRKFYERYDEWMIYQCSRSPFTIRAPYKLSGSFYEKNESDAMNQFKEGQVNLAEADSRSRYNPSYFAYRGVTRLYKFFASTEFSVLEKRYVILKTLDVSRCFDSIYTHSISWALMGKSVAKNNKVAETSADAFDRLMRNINHGETSGIVIGPEVSRIFAEMIFQTIDTIAVRSLSNRKFRHGVEYSLRRYVDDIYIFADSSAIAEQVYDTYTDAMADFNLYANPQKMTMIPRPFVTRKSSVIDKARVLVDGLSLKLFANYNQKGKQLWPNDIWQKDRVPADFITAIKTICFDSQAGYHDLSSYIISALSERAKLLVKRKKKLDAEEQSQYFTVVSILLRLMFFLYTVAPTVTASYKLAVGVTLLLRFARRKLPLASPAIEQLIYSEGLVVLNSEGQRKSASLSRFVSLEAINVLLFMQELGESYLIPADNLRKLFTHGVSELDCGEWCYFDIVTCVFYIQNRPEYASLKKLIDQEVDRRLKELNDVGYSAEKAYLLLDMLTCPYVIETRKEKWLSLFRNKFSISPYSTTELKSFMSSNDDNQWFVNWRQVDILTMLQKKEVIQAY